MRVVTPKHRAAPPEDSAEAKRLDRSFLKVAYPADFDGVIAALEAGADIDFADPGSGLAALHIAVGTNQVTLGRDLIEEWGATIGPDGRGRRGSPLSRPATASMTTIPITSSRPRRRLDMLLTLLQTRSSKYPSKGDSYRAKATWKHVGEMGGGSSQGDAV